VPEYLATGGGLTRDGEYKSTGRWYIHCYFDLVLVARGRGRRVQSMVAAASGRLSDYSRYSEEVGAAAGRSMSELS